MRKVLFALVFAVALSAVNVSFADYLPTLRQIDNGNPNVLTYIVGLEVDDAGGISSISDVNVTGDVCQVFVFGGQQTPEEFFISFFPEYAVFDTHLLDLDQYGIGDVTVGDGWTEDNDGSDPAGINSSAEGLCVSGIGDLYLTGTPTTTAVQNPLWDLTAMEFIQVVIPYDPSDPTRYSATVTGLYCNYMLAEAGTMVPFSIHVGIVPEPSTVALLCCGGLGLAMMWFRRRRA